MNSQPPEIRVIISGGGTGGHIFPALAIANALKEINSNNKILFVGAQGRMEMEKVPKAGYEIIGLNITGIKRSLSLSNIKVPFRILSSLWKAKKIIRSFKPDVVIGVGGYASGPVLFAAGMMKVPTLIQEQNSYAGVTNRILGKKAKSICVAYDNMERYFPADKILITGNPVRQDIGSGKIGKEEAAKYFGLDPDKKILLVIGGSLGARTINRSLAIGWKALSEFGMQVLWQTGKAFYAEAQNQEKHSEGMLKVLDFIPRMDMAYSAADIIVSRAGASSLSELAIVGKPVVLVPSPNVAEDHQTKNAMALVEKNAAVLVVDDKAKDELIDRVLDLVKSESVCGQLSVEIKKMAKNGADKKIAEEVYRLFENKN
ncbi:MAG TPA: undecaprenyldiphospho-muramoylpentapeptide beta-N-acetylglucosaminyltransferase [Bacteroidia bacterium]|nr:undecaprenyldiphospho-muramoylpentapeptide beta-N-acetylglucosaminyltransferase [Bacteroidia bacterium]HNS12273.1 undecaprenyldiphospho-muramoylpentapeptide beta-N-acetylglucosaminyltransferase [Bacteroidia bacterium]